jgi:Glycosyl hydrolase family 26
MIGSRRETVRASPAALFRTPAHRQSSARRKFARACIVGFSLAALSPTLVSAPQATASSRARLARFATGTRRASTSAAKRRPKLALPSPTSSAGLREGVYVGPIDPAGVSAFATATGTTPTIASEYLPANSGWSGLDGADGSLAWLTSGWRGSGYTLSLGVPMIPTNSAGIAQGTLAIGASGAYNSYFATLAQTLVAAGDGRSYLRLGWEFNGAWYPWKALSVHAEARYAEYFRQIVTTMRAVPGASFQFVWNPQATAFTEAGYSVRAAYPGDAYVNDVGIDFYDQSAGTATSATAWADLSQPALSAASSFAGAEHKPIVVCEWGVALQAGGQGPGDDPLYVANMIAWMKDPANHVVYESYFDYNALPSGGGIDAKITGGQFPRSLSTFIHYLG